MRSHGSCCWSPICTDLTHYLLAPSIPATQNRLPFLEHTVHLHVQPLHVCFLCSCPKCCCGRTDHLLQVSARLSLEEASWLCTKTALPVSLQPALWLSLSDTFHYYIVTICCVMPCCIVSCCVIIVHITQCIYIVWLHNMLLYTVTYNVLHYITLYCIFTISHDTIYVILLHYI